MSHNDARGIVFTIGAIMLVSGIKSLYDLNCPETWKTKINNFWFGSGGAVIVTGLGATGIYVATH